MATEVALPNLGEGIDDADVLRVLVAAGDTIAIDEPMLEIETEKATLDVPSTVAGTVVSIHVAPGDTIRVGQLLLTVDAVAGQAADPAAAPATPEPVAEPQPQPQPDAEQAEPAETAPDEAAAAEPSTAAPATAEPSTAEPSTAAPATAEPATAEPIPAAAEAAPAPAAPAPAPSAADGATPVFAAPSVRKFAREIGVDIAAVAGSGPGGRISEDDVKEHARAVPAAPPAAAPSAASSATTPPSAAPERRPLPDFSQWGHIDREPLSRLRRTVARNMSAAWAQIPHVTLHRTADVTAMEELRQQYKQRARDAGGNLTISVFMLKVVAAALKAHPRMNTSLDTDTNELIYKRYYNIGVAVDTERGLVVPVIRDVDSKNIIQLSIELNEIAERARNNELTLEDGVSGTFTLTNLGSLGTGFFSPVINLPEVAVLGLGRAQQLPELDEHGQWQPRLQMPMSLSHDHRVIDGADGARFMQWIIDAIANPLLLALEG